MSEWNRTGPVVVEVDGSAENLRVVDYASTDALQAGAELVLVAPYSEHSSYSPMMPGYAPKPPAELADDAVRAAVAHGGALAVDPVACRSVAAMTCPVAIVPHHAADSERTAGRAKSAVPTY